MAKSNSKNNAGSKSRSRSKKPADTAMVPVSEGAVQATPAVDETAPEPVGTETETPASQEPTPETPATENGSGGLQTITLYRRIENKAIRYGQPGVHGSLRFSKNMFANGQHPDVITITGFNLATPSEKTVKAGVSAEEKAKKAQESAQKAIARAEKMKLRADKAAALAAKLSGAVS